jgi:ubiquinone/menaquinone biosynthesis C-methylase UbiE
LKLDSWPGFGDGKTRVKIQASQRRIADPGRQRAAAVDRSALPGVAADPAIPAYLRDVYHWAYLDPANARLLDHDSIVSTILLGNNARLRRTLIAEILTDHRVLQVAHVYGNLIPEMARQIGSGGYLDVIDLVPLQVAMCRKKLREFPQARVRVANATNPGTEFYDVVSCFFLLHEIPDELKHAVVDALLLRVNPGGRVVFVDYHNPAKWHPLRAVMRQLFKRLEPFAESLWHHPIADFASAPQYYRWEKQTFFGGLYQKTVACRL